MDILKYLARKNLDEFSKNYNYDTNFLGDALFRKEKTNNLTARIKQLVKNGNLPAIAKFAAFNTEAPVGSREKFEEKYYEKLLIKEKIQVGETEMYLKNWSEDEIIDHLYDDMSIETQRVLARAELANMQVLSTGALTIDENDFKSQIDYGYNTDHNVNFTAWNDPKHSIVNDLEDIIAAAKAEGREIRRAVTSAKVVGYMVKNEELVLALNSINLAATRKNVLNYILEAYGIDFVENDRLYKIEGGDEATHRFFPENKISFFGDEEFGVGLLAPTPSEMQNLKAPGETDERQFVYLDAWSTKDPAATWTMGSMVYLPLPLDIDNLFIATVTETTVAKA